MSGMVGAVPFLNVATSQNTKISNSGSNGQWNKTNTPGDSFFQTLQEVVNGSKGEGLTNPISANELSIPIDRDELLVLLQQLIEKLLPEDRQLHEDMVEGNLIDGLLEEIPIPLLEELFMLFEEQMPLDELLTEESLNDPVQMLALMIAFTHMEEKQVIQVQGELKQFLPSLHDHVAKYFPIQIGDKERVSWSQFVEKLTEQLKLFNKDGEKTVDTNTNLRSWLAAFNEKFNEREVIQSLYGRVFQANNGDKTTITPILALDSTNSHMARLQQFFIHSGEQEATRQSENQFLRQIENILARSQFRHLGNGMQQLTVKLHPASLGRLDITIQQINGVIVAKMMTTTAMAKELIESQLHQLRHAFTAQQLQVDRIEVTHQQQTEANPFKEQEHEEQNHEQHHHNQAESDEMSEEESFATFLAETINMEV